MSEIAPTPFLNSVLALRPPLATSTRTDLSPSFKLLHSIVNQVYGSPGLRGLEPGLWRAQLIRAAHRSAQLIQAIWTKLGGQAGVIVDDQGEGSRGVMRLQGVLSDLQMFIGSLTTVQDPLTTLLLDPVAFSRTQATITALIKKLSNLVHHYKVADLLPTPVDQWPEEDAEDKAEDLGALPILIAKSRPTKAVLQKFEAECAQRDQAEPSDSDLVDNPDQDGGAESNPSSSLQSSVRPPTSVSLANCGLSAAKRTEFLRFVYSQNSKLIPTHETLESAVAAGAAALSTLPPSSKSAFQSLAKGDGGFKPRKSLVQQRISSFATSSDAAPPLPSSSLNGLNPARRIVSEGPKNATRKSWAVDMSAFDGIQRKSSASISKPAPHPGLASQVSVAALPVDWKSSISRPPSVHDSSPHSAVPSESKTQATSANQARRLSRSTESSSDRGESIERPLAQPNLAEQAAAIVAARKSRVASQSSLSSVPQAPSSTSLADRSELASTTGLPANPEHPLSSEPIKPSNSSISDPPAASKLATSSEPYTAPNFACSFPTVPATAEQVTSSTSPTSGNSPSPSRSVILLPSSQPATPPKTASMDRSHPGSLRAPSPSLATQPHSVPSITPPPKSPAAILSPSSVRSVSFGTPSGGRRPSLTPSASVPDADFELVTDLIEHTSMLDVIIASEEVDPEDVTETVDSSILAPDTNLVSTSDSSVEAQSTPILALASSSNQRKSLPAEELSLADLMEQASMYETWVPESEGKRPEPPHSPNQNIDSVESQPAIRSPPNPSSSTSFPSPLSPDISIVRSPFILDGSKSPTTSILSAQPPLPRSLKPSLPSLQPTDNSLGILPDGFRSEAALTMASSVSPTRSLSAQSWATSFMSSPPLPADFDERLLSSKIPGSIYTKDYSKEFIPCPQDPLKTGWRILCLDGGGVRGLSMLYTIRELMLSIQVRLRLRHIPCPFEVFDMICGVGTGGIIALLLGRLKLNISLAIEAYLQIVRQVFGQSKGVIAAVRRKARFSASKLESVIRDLVKQLSGQSDLSLYDAVTGTRCRTFVIHMKPSSKGDGVTIRKLRSYHSRKVMADSCHLAQAARATSPTPIFFKPLKSSVIEDADSQPADVTINNPSLEAINEAKELFPDRPIDCLISLGAGQGTSVGSNSISRACAQMAKSCDRTAQLAQARSQKEGWSENYFRVSVNGLRNEETRGEWEVPDLVKAGTVKYLYIDEKDAYEAQLARLIGSWERAYDDGTLQGLMRDDHSGVATPRSAAFPSMREKSKSKTDGLRKSISADLPELDGRDARSSFDKSYRIYKMSQASTNTAKTIINRQKLMDNVPSKPNSLTSNSPLLQDPSSIPPHTTNQQRGPSLSPQSNLLSLDLQLPGLSFSNI